MEFEDSINITSDVLDHIFQILGTNDVTIKQIVDWLFYSKIVKMIFPALSKIYIIL